jgi:hypothetical protein
MNRAVCVQAASPPPPPSLSLFGIIQQGGMPKSEGSNTANALQLMGICDIFQVISFFNTAALPTTCERPQEKAAHSDRPVWNSVGRCVELKKALSACLALCAVCLVSCVSWQFLL